MKKLLLSAFALAVAMSAAAFNLAPNRMQTATLSSMDNVKKAPKELVQKRLQQKFAELQKKNGLSKLDTPTKASDVVGGYTWTYSETETQTVDPDSAVVSATYTTNVVMYNANDADSTFMIAGMFPAPVSAKLDAATFASYGTSIFIPTYDVTQTVYYYNNNGTYIPCTLRAIFYYEGDATYSAGWYVDDGFWGLIYQGEIIFMEDYVYMTLKIGSTNYRLSDYIIPYSEMVDNADINGIMTYDRNYGTNYTLTDASALTITEDENCVVSVKNFAGIADADKVATFNLAADHTWKADASVIATQGDSLNFQLIGLAADTSAVYLEGTGNETQLTFGSNWTLMDLESYYWFGVLNPATITLLDGEFVYPTAAPDVYIMGEVGDNTWAPNVGQQMTLDEETGLYTANIECKDNDNNGYDYFSFTTKLADNADDWDGIAAYRFGAVSDGDFWVTDDMLGVDLSLTKENYQAFRIPAGEYDLTLDYANMKLKIEKVAPTVKLGDVNGDGDVNVNDVTVLINYILGKNPTPFVEANANVNGDEGINVNDVTALINMILN